MSSDESYFDVQVARAEQNALVAELVDQGVQLAELVERYMDDVKRAVEVLAARPRRRPNGRARPPGHLSRQVMNDAEKVGELLGQATAAIDRVLRDDDAGRTPR